ncbi:DUF3885 domain-containing protein [Alkalihalobacillus deserti]|uniref:DUF3885 domain-containing protein n=1 Tax=Alkalihalobacillus deserti TaxID=2879466 RepID=UPI001D15AA0E|nr:hypothetical protein [Alkalihalobacillus deserti]
MSSTLTQFLAKHFDGLILRPPLFYLWDYGIRFEITVKKLMIYLINERITVLYQCPKSGQNTKQGDFNDGT